jgi:hypothetical protein
MQSSPRRRLTWVVTILSCLSNMLLVGFGSAARAETTVTQFRVKGDTAVATFDAIDPTNPCIRNFVSAVASDLIEKEKPGDKIVFVQTVLVVGQVDEGSGFALFSAEGETPDQAFHVAGDLSSAPLNTTVTVFDSISLQFHDFDVDLTWTALREPERRHSKETFADKDLGVKISTRLQGRGVEAWRSNPSSGLLGTSPSSYR